MSWIEYYNALCSELKSRTLYDAVSKRIDKITEAIEGLSDDKHATVRTALAEIQMLIQAGGGDK